MLPREGARNDTGVHVTPIARTMLPLALASAVAVGLAGCGGGDGDTSGASSSSSPASATPAAPSAPTSANAAATDDAQVSQQQAEQIALTTAGAGSSVVETEADDEDGRAVWKVEVTVNGQKRKIEVDRTTGAVVKNEAGD